MNPRKKKPQIGENELFFDEKVEETVKMRNKSPNGPKKSEECENKMQ